MKKLLFITTLLSAVLVIPVFAASDTFKFRGLKWGSSIDDVIEAQLQGKAEGVDYGFTDDGHSIVAINEKVGGLDTNISYTFTEDNKFALGMYVLQEEHVNDNMYYEDFCSLEEKLSSKYGDPDKSVDKWNDDLYKDNPDKIGMALGAEHLALYRQWFAEDGACISLMCYGQNFDIDTYIFYDAPTALGLEPYSSDSDDGL